MPILIHKGYNQRHKIVYIVLNTYTGPNPSDMFPPYSIMETMVYQEASMAGFGNNFVKGPVFQADRTHSPKQIASYMFNGKERSILDIFRTFPHLGYVHLNVPVVSVPNGTIILRDIIDCFSVTCIGTRTDHPTAHITTCHMHVLRNLGHNIGETIPVVKSLIPFSPQHVDVIVMGLGRPNRNFLERRGEPRIDPELQDPNYYNFLLHDLLPPLQTSNVNIFLARDDAGDTSRRAHTLITATELTKDHRPNWVHKEYDIERANDDTLRALGLI